MNLTLHSVGEVYSVIARNDIVPVEQAVSCYKEIASLRSVLGRLSGKPPSPQ